MMQIWNAFLPGVHITMLARKMTYKAAVSIFFIKLENIKSNLLFFYNLSVFLLIIIGVGLSN
jgi:hypothetical protein